MEEIKIKPNKLSGEIKIPPSKSMAHRAIICASLSKGISKITNIDYSNDIIATIKAMESLGTKFIKTESELIIDGTETFSKKNSFIDCNESGSTLRFLVPISIVKENKVNIVGTGFLGKRPITTFYEIFDRQNIKYTYKEDVLDLNIDGQLKPDTFKIKGNISSQFISGLLFSLPLLEGDSVIEITTHLESKSYIDLTLSMLKTFGIEVLNENYEKFIVKGNQAYKPKDYEVEGDYSQGAFFYCANFIGNEIKIIGLDENSLQGDKQCVDIINEFFENNEKEITIDANNCPDIIPVVTVAASLRKGRTIIINAGRLRIKECDRLNAIATELNKIGGKIQELEDSLIIDGVENFTGGHVSSYDDHRIAMSMAIASTRCNKELIIDNKKCVAKSYPSFWEDFKSLGGIFN